MGCLDLELAESILMCLRLRFGRFVFVALAGLFVSAVTLSTIIFPSLVLDFNNTYGLSIAYKINPRMGIYFIGLVGFKE